MIISEVPNQKNMTKHRLMKDSGLPLETNHDICRGKKQSENMLRDRPEEPKEHRISFDVFKSNVCHRVKDIGDLDFIIATLESNAIRVYYQKKWIAEALYLLAMVDYLSRLNDLPLCNEYDDLRRKRLAKPLYPMSVVMADALSQTTKHAENSYQKAIPEFLRHNIIEGEIRDVV